MKLGNLDKALTDSDGKEFPDGVTLRTGLHTAASALFNSHDQDPGEKYKAGVIAVKLKKAQKSVLLSSEEVTLLKVRVGKLFPPVVVMRIEDALEERKTVEQRIANEIDQDDEEKK